MKSTFLPFVILCAFFLSNCGNEKSTPQHVVFDWKVDSTKFDFAKYVDPMIGTAGHGHTFPGATAPFGMVQVSPDTRVDGSWDGCSGYHYSDSIIYGFSHTHLSGTGCSDYGDILFMPGNTYPMFDNDPEKKYNYTSTFAHKNEHAEAGYYSVVLDKSKVKVELTASPRVGVHRYTFPTNDSNWIILDLKHRDEVVASEINIVNDHAIQGFRESKAWANDQKLFFYVEFSEPFTSIPNGMRGGKWDELQKDSGKNVQVRFDLNGKSSVVIKVALSAVSCENAQLNMETEVPDFDFDAVHKKVLQQWNSELGKIEVKTNDETKKKIFYTALYHCCIAPNLYCDVNGEYRGMDNKIHTDTIHPQYTVFSLWDTYRALHPLFTIFQPKRDQDFINTFVKQYKEGGKLPVWELSANETNCMIGYHSIPVIVDAWMKGLTDFDTATAYEAMKVSAMQNTNGLDLYKKFGYIPAESEGESVSKTLEYAYDDWCIALAAKRMKQEKDYQYFLRRSQSWRNLLDSKTGFFRPRLNNSFAEPFDPNEVNFHFTEANAWQYSLAVQQDIPELIKTFGGDKKFITHLDSLFSVSSKTSGRDQSDISGMIGQYAQGNEPSHHMAYLYNFTSQPWKTQEMVSKICNEMYTDKPDGLCGNEDCGQMSAWYVLSSICFYPVSPGGNDFQIGSPQFPEVIFHLENGKTFTLKAKNAGNGNIYLDTVIVNGIIDTKYNSFQYDLIKNGGSLELKMQNVPRTKMPELPCVDYRQDFTHQFLIAPIISNFSGRTFDDRITIALRTNSDLAKIKYCLNKGAWQDYHQPISISEHATLEAYAYILNGSISDTSFTEFSNAPKYNSIAIKNKYANQYSAGGDRALIDGIRGGNNFRTGDWQGYEGTDLDAIVDLGSAKDISRITIGFLQDQGSWIFFPSAVIFYSSMDGKIFNEVEVSKNVMEQNTQSSLLKDFVTEKIIKARYIKIVAKNSGPCPNWHPGKGKPSWIFADEIFIESK